MASTIFLNLEEDRLFTLEARHAPADYWFNIVRELIDVSILRVNSSVDLAIREKQLYANSEHFAVKYGEEFSRQERASFW